MDCRGGTNPGCRRTGSERGSVLVEFALVFALFVLVIYAVISFGVILAAKNNITHAAAEGARSAIGVVDDPGTPDDERIVRARTKLNDSMSWFSRYEESDTSAVIAPCGTKSCITVTITYPYDDRPIVPPTPGLGLVLPSNLTSTAIVELN